MPISILLTDLSIDPNVKEQLAILDPMQGAALKASKEVAVSNSNWVSCLDLDSSSEWLVCGGGGKYLSLWYLPMQHVTSYLPMLAPVQDVFFYEDSVSQLCALHVRICCSLKVCRLSQLASKTVYIVGN